MPDEYGSQPDMQKTEDRNSWLILIIILLIAMAGYGVIAYTMDLWPFEEPVTISLDETTDERPDDLEEEIQCLDVPTSAQNPETGEIVTFDSVCDVPEGWEVVYTGRGGDTAGASTSDTEEGSEMEAEDPKSPRTGAGEWLAVIFAGLCTFSMWIYKRKQEARM